MTMYEIRDQFDYKLGTVTAIDREDARKIGKRIFKKTIVHVIKIR